MRYPDFIVVFHNGSFTRYISLDDLERFYGSNYHSAKQHFLECCGEGCLEPKEIEITHEDFYGTYEELWEFIRERTGERWERMWEGWLWKNRKVEYVSLPTFSWRTFFIGMIVGGVLIIMIGRALL